MHGDTQFVKAEGLARKLLCRDGLVMHRASSSGKGEMDDSYTADEICVARNIRTHSRGCQAWHMERCDCGVREAFVALERMAAYRRELEKRGKKWEKMNKKK